MEHSLVTVKESVFSISQLQSLCGIIRWQNPTWTHSMMKNWNAWQPSPEQPTLSLLYGKTCISNSLPTTIQSSSLLSTLLTKTIYSFSQTKKTKSCERPKRYTPTLWRPSRSKSLNNLPYLTKIISPIMLRMAEIGSWVISDLKLLTMDSLNSSSQAILFR